MSLPKTYKQAAFHEQGGSLKIEEVSLTEPGKGELLVKVEACGVCHSDQFAQNNVYGKGFPFVPGHEYIGNVAAIGEGVSGFKVNDRVGGGWHGGHDGTCKACQKGLFQMCDQGMVNGVTKFGGYAEYALLRSEAAVRIPEHIDAKKYAPLLCAGVTVYNSMRQMNISPGSIVAVQGLGGLGHLAIQYAQKFGCRVVALSRDSDKEQFARELGAHDYIDGSKVNQAEALQKLGGASLIVTTATSAKAIGSLLGGLGLLGKLLVLSVPGEDVNISIATMVHYGLSVHSWPSGHATDTEEAIDFADLNKIDCLTQTWPLDKANEAFEAMCKGTVRFRAVVTM